VGSGALISVCSLLLADADKLIELVFMTNSSWQTNEMSSQMIENYLIGQSQEHLSVCVRLTGVSTFWAITGRSFL
jgi:hypothetical protein